MLSNNKDKLLVHTYVYSQKHNYIPYSTFTFTTVQLHVLAINIGHLQVVDEAPYDKLYLHVSDGTVCGVGWVRDHTVFGSTTQTLKKFGDMCVCVFVTALLSFAAVDMMSLNNSKRSLKAGCVQ